MNRLTIGVVLGMLLVLGVLKTHVVVDGQGVFLVRKDSMTLEHTYVETGELGPGEFASLPPAIHERLAARRAEQAGEALEQAGEEISDAVEDMGEALEG